jgi:hypothetical protein
VTWVTGLLTPVHEEWQCRGWIEVAFRGKGASLVAGQVLDISKHESAVKSAPSGLAGQRARIYRFPSKPAAAPPPPDSKEDTENQIRYSPGLELVLGLVFWLIWFIWHLTR